MAQGRGSGRIQVAEFFRFAREEREKPLPTRSEDRMVRSAVRDFENLCKYHGVLGEYLEGARIFKFRIHPKVRKIIAKLHEDTHLDLSWMKLKINWISSGITSFMGEHYTSTLSKLVLEMREKCTMIQDAIARIKTNLGFSRINRRIVRPCLGKGVAVGQIYDARCDTLFNANIFQQNRGNGEGLDFVWNHSTSLHNVQTDTFSDRCQAMGVTGDTQLSVLANMVTPEGCERFINGQRLTSRNGQKSWVYTHFTGSESVNFSDQAVLNGISTKALDRAKKFGTHVVAKVLYGGRMIFSCLDQGEPDFQSDMPLRDIFQRPQNFQDFMNLVREVENGIANGDNGSKGGPIAMELIPLQQLQQYLDQPVTLQPSFVPVPEKVVRRIVHAHENLQEYKQELFDFLENVRRFKCCVSDEDVQWISECCQQIEELESYSGSRLASLLLQVRGGRGEVDLLEEMLNEIRKKSVPIVATVDGCDWIKEKVNIAQLFKSRGIKYIGEGASLDLELLGLPAAEKAYLLFFTQTQKAEDPNGWTENLNLFLAKLDEEGGDGSNFFPVDCDFHHNLKKSSIRIQVVRGNLYRVIQEDLLRERGNGLV